MANPTRARNKTRDDESTTVKLKLLPGKGARGREFDFGAPEAAAAVVEPVVKIPKPRKTRYPISLAEFNERKAAARLKEKLDRRGVTLVQDKRARRTEIAAAPMAAGAGPLPTPPGPAGVVTPLANFRGIPFTSSFPPDCTMAVGPNHVMVSVNSRLAVFAKTGGAALLQRSLDAWFANVVTGMNIFDPKLLFDQHAGRWLLLAVALGPANRSFFLLSASTTADPTGTWRNFALDAARDGTTATNNWADYPGLGVDAHAIYLTANMFQVGGNFMYSKIRIVPKTPVYSGGVVTFSDLVRMRNSDNSIAFTVQPCHTYGAPQVAHFVNSLFPSGNRLTLWSLANPLTSPALTRRNVAVAPYDLPPDATQQGGAAPLDSGDVRILHAIFRGGSVWTALTTRQAGAGGANTAAAHWFQINASTGTLVQQGIFTGVGRHFFYPSIAPDSNGNAVLVFCVSSGSERPSIHFTGRAAGDPLGQMRPSLLLKGGVASYTNTDNFARNRWGDYNGIAADPAQGTTLWFYSMFSEAVNQWGTWVGSARL